MKTSFIINVILTIFTLSYLISAFTFVVKQKMGASFLESIDKALIRGAWLFALGSGMSFITVFVGNIPQMFI